MNISGRIKRSISNRQCDVFLRVDFESFGSPAQISRALNELQGQGVLVRLGYGVYAKAKPSVLSGKPIPAKPLEVLAPEALGRLGVNARPARLTRDYNAGRSSQIPAGVVINIGRRRIVRKLGFNGNVVAFERA